jgi:hypothetical protein
MSQALVMASDATTVTVLWGIMGERHSGVWEGKTSPLLPPPVPEKQPLCLLVSGTERRRYNRSMNLRNRKHHSVSLRHVNWTAHTLCLAVTGEAFVLTSPFIELIRTWPCEWAGFL